MNTTQVTNEVQINVAEKAKTVIPVPVVSGKQNFMGHEIPVVEGGFGENAKCVSDKTVAEIHGIKMYHARELISKNKKRFQQGIDFIDLKERIGQNDTLELLQGLGYAKQSTTQAAHIYLFSERGYAKLIKIMDTDLAWEIHDKLIDEYFVMRKIVDIESWREKFYIPQTYGDALQLSAQLQKEKEQLQKEKTCLIEQLQEDSPKVEEWERFMDSDGTISMNDTAKLLHTGRNQLMSFLKHEKILLKDRSAATRYVKQGYFHVDIDSGIGAYGREYHIPVTRTTAKGLSFLYKYLKKHYYEYLEYDNDFVLEVE